MHIIGAFLLLFSNHLCSHKKLNNFNFEDHGIFSICEHDESNFIVWR